VQTFIVAVEQTQQQADPQAEQRDKVHAAAPQQLPQGGTIPAHSNHAQIRNHHSYRLV